MSYDQHRNNPQSLLNRLVVLLKNQIDLTESIPKEAQSLNEFERNQLSLQNHLRQLKNQFCIDVCKSNGGGIESDCSKEIQCTIEQLLKTQATILERINLHRRMTMVANLKTTKEAEKQLAILRRKLLVLTTNSPLEQDDLRILIRLFEQRLEELRREKS